MILCTDWLIVTNLLENKYMLDLFKNKEYDSLINGHNITYQGPSSKDQGYAWPSMDHINHLWRDEMMYSFFLYGKWWSSQKIFLSIPLAPQCNMLSAQWPWPRPRREKQGKGIHDKVRFTQRSWKKLDGWMAARGDSHMITEPMKEVIKATTLTVNWNWRNLLMLS